jgi:hypothetical protein
MEYRTDMISGALSGDQATTLLSTLNIKGVGRFKAAKELSIIAKEHPDTLYGHFNALAELLDSSSSVLLWNGLLILGSLARVDNQHRLDKIIDKYLSHLWDKKLVTAANVVIGAGQIMRFRPDLLEQILPNVLKVDDIPLPTVECHQVIRSHVLSAFANCFESIKDNRRVFEFTQRCAESNRPATRKKAEELLRSLPDKW